MAAVRGHRGCSSGHSVAYPDRDRDSNSEPHSVADADSDPNSDPRDGDADSFASANQYAIADHSATLD
jgi:hypothetical protein